MTKKCLGYFKTNLFYLLLSGKTLNPMKIIFSALIIHVKIYAICKKEIWLLNISKNYILQITNLIIFSY